MGEGQDGHTIMDAFGKISESIRSTAQEDIHPFYLFEPWDVVKRSEDILKKAIQDGIDLEDPVLCEHIGTAPHLFQSGYLLSTDINRYILGGSQIGKALEKDTLVSCESGLIEIGNLKVGDRVFGTDGKLHSVTGVYPQGTRSTFEFSFGDGASCVADEDHLWNVVSFRNCSERTWHGNGRIGPNLQFGKIETISTRDIVKTCGTGDIHSTKRFRIPSHAPLEWGKTKKSIPPYSVGVMIGDGSLTTKSFSVTCHGDDEQIMDRVAFEMKDVADVFKTPSRYVWRIAVREEFDIHGEMDRLGLKGAKSDNKSIPKEYKYTSSEDRIDILRGLMDTDGSVYGKGVVEFSSKSLNLANDVVWLVRSLGGQARMASRNTGYKKDGVRTDCGIRYRVMVGLRNINPFYLKRKADKWYKIKHSQDRRIRKIMPSGMRETVCISVASPDKCFVLGNGIVTHNSMPAKIEVIIMATGEIPYSMRYPLGYDTKIKRLISKENIHRFGRFDSITGSFLDYDTNASASNSWNEWDCGTIKGVGVYPQEKIAPSGSQIWIGTFAEAKKLYWWPSLGEPGTMITPDKFLDHSKGNNGVNKQEDTIHFIRNMKIAFLTYEQGHRRFEAQMAWAYFADEETPNKDIFYSAQQHAKYRSMLMSPINGITWTRKILFPEKKEEGTVLFHATQYDSPYQNVEDIENRRQTMETWYRTSRIWGIPTEVRGNPFFNRRRISIWRNKFKIPYKLCSFIPSREVTGILHNPINLQAGYLMNTSIRKDVELSENRTTTWRMYEDVMENVAYILSADPAEGEKNPDAAADVCAAGIMRLPIGKETSPVIVCTARSTLEPIPFARICLYAARYYNNALLCAETRRGSANASFAAESAEWPYWYKHSSIQDSTGKSKEHIGFDTNSATRDSIFSLIEDQINTYGEEEYPYIPDEFLMKELECAVIGFTAGGKKRCDHTGDGTLDSAVWFGIILYVIKNAKNQIRCNLLTKPKERHSGGRSFFGKPQQGRAICGLDALGYGRNENGDAK